MGHLVFHFQGKYAGLVLQAIAGERTVVEGLTNAHNSLKSVAEEGEGRFLSEC